MYKQAKKGNNKQLNTIIAVFNLLLSRKAGVKYEESAMLKQYVGSYDSSEKLLKKVAAFDIGFYEHWYYKALVDKIEPLNNNVQFMKQSPKILK